MHWIRANVEAPGVAREKAEGLWGHDEELASERAATRHRIEAKCLDKRACPLGLLLILDRRLISPSLAR